MNQIQHIYAIAVELAKKQSDQATLTRLKDLYGQVHPGTGGEPKIDAQLDQGTAGNPTPPKK